MKRLIAITVDDEPLALERVSTLVRESAELTLAGEATNGLRALDLITETEPDLVFIDIEMPELSGFGVIAALDGSKIPGIVFITAFEHYAIKAFEVGAIDYLPKPVTKARFDSAVARAKERLSDRSADQNLTVIADANRAERARGWRTRFVVRRGNAHYFVPVQDVDWIDAADNYLQLHSSDRTHMWRGTMKEAEDQLDPKQFVRIHRSAIVALDRIISVASNESQGYVVELRGGTRLRTSRQYSDHVRQLLL
jgi:two-component system LytT family response regulator